MSDIEIEIDGKKLQAKPNAMVIQVADEAGIYIPRFCYHKHLSIAANCRMCLVEVEKSPKALPACATPVMPGMKVFTKSPKALAAQKAVMEFLLINHPLDCPICDQGGECELQDISMGFGPANSYYTEGKRSVKDKDIGPLIATEMTRCIHCTRCVRFGAEVAGMRELGATGRGEHMEIGTYIEHAMKSEVSGNVIDICPVGALTSKPYRFTARAWELEQRPTVSPHDCIGSNLYAHRRNGRVMRMVPRENGNINETWISDRDRFSYEGLYHADRVSKPLIKKNGQWQETDWQTALEFAAGGLQKVLSEQGPAQLGALASPNSTTEEFYLFQKLMRGLGCSNIDHRLRQADFSDQEHVAAFPGLGLSVAALEQCDAICLVGSNMQREQPAAFLRVRKAALQGAKIMALNVMDYAFNVALAEKQIVSPDEMVPALAAIAKSLFDMPQANPSSEDAGSRAKSMHGMTVESLQHVKTTEASNAIAKQLVTAKQACLLLGHIAFHHPQAALIRTLCTFIATRSGAHLGFLTDGANAAGGWLAGAVPHRGAAAATVNHPGLDAQAVWNTPRKAYFLLNVEPEDCANPPAVNHALQQAEFVVSLSVFRHPTLDQHAHVILPVGPYTETAGTFVNATGDWQFFTGVAVAFEEARPAWKVLRVLGNLFHLADFDYTSAEIVRHEIKALVEKMSFEPSCDIKIPAEPLKWPETQHLYRIGSVPIYSGDNLTRRAEALQAAQPILEGDLATVRVHPQLAARLSLQEGSLVNVKQKGQVKLPVVFDSRLPERGVWVATATPITNELSELFGQVEFVK
jgi:NADH-quinone oxidoreductase subunit G